LKYLSKIKKLVTFFPQSISIAQTDTVAKIQKQKKNLISCSTPTKDRNGCPKVEFSPAPYIRIEAPANILFI